VSRIVVDGLAWNFTGFKPKVASLEQLNTQGWIYDCASPRLRLFSAKSAM
jgi:hypothetical protein